MNDLKHRCPHPLFDASMNRADASANTDKTHHTSCDVRIIQHLFVSPGLFSSKYIIDTVKVNVKSSGTLYTVQVGIEKLIIHHEEDTHSRHESLAHDVSLSYTRYDFHCSIVVLVLITVAFLS